MIFQTKVLGFVYDKISGEPIEGATVKARYGTLSGYGEIIIAATTITDDKGYFKLKFRAQKDWDYILCVSKEPDYPACDPEWSDLECYCLYSADLDEGKGNEIVFSIEKWEYDE